MFHSARFRLTLWYLVIIAFISFLFSGIIYRDVVNELERGFFLAERRLRGVSAPEVPKQKAKLILEDELNDAKQIVFLRLLIFNGIILVIAGVGGYILAGKTLQPIEAALEKQKRFIGDASHELRTPLTSLKSEIEVALRDKKLNVSGAKKLLRSNLEETDKMQKLMNYLLSLSKYEGGQNNFIKKRIDLSKIVAENAEKYKSQAKSKNIKLTLSTTEVFAKVNGASIEQLVSILIDNAVKYTPQGKSISLSLRKTRNNAVIEVKDGGIGIGEKDLPHIFDRFYRSDTSRSKKEADGYGLGLSIAKSIVDAHKGEIKVESKVGKGSTFTIFLPR